MMKEGKVGGGVEEILCTRLSHKYGKGTARLSQPPTSRMLSVVVGRMKNL